jgi:hypothetical protein
VARLYLSKVLSFWRVMNWMMNGGILLKIGLLIIGAVFG